MNVLISILLVGLPMALLFFGGFAAGWNFSKGRTAWGLVAVAIATLPLGLFLSSLMGKPPQPIQKSMQHQLQEHPGSQRK